MGFYAKDEPEQPVAERPETERLSRDQEPWPENSWPPILTVGIGHRFYNPGLGRWLSRDPIGETGGLGIYLIVADDPVNSIDYLGLIDPDVNYTNPDSLESKALKHVPDPQARKQMVIVYAHSGLIDARRPTETPQYISMQQLIDDIGPHIHGKCKVWLIVCNAGDNVVGEEESSLVARLADLLRIKTGRTISVSGPEGVVRIWKEGTKSEGKMALEDKKNWVVRPKPTPPPETPKHD